MGSPAHAGIDPIIAYDKDEREEILTVLRKHKITRWPDGRPIEEVVTIRNA